MKCLFIVTIVALLCGSLAAPTIFKGQKSAEAIKEDTALEDAKNEDGTVRKKKSCVDIHPGGLNQKSFTVCDPPNGPGYNKGPQTFSGFSNSLYGSGSNYNGAGGNIPLFGAGSNSNYNGAGVHGFGTGSGISNYNGAGVNGFGTGSGISNYNGAGVSGFGAGSGISNYNGAGVHGFGAGSGGYGAHSSSGYGGGPSVPFPGRPLFSHTSSVVPHSAGSYSASSHGGYKAAEPENLPPGRDQEPHSMEAHLQESVGAARSKIFGFPYYQSPYPVPSYHAPSYNAPSYNAPSYSAPIYEKPLLPGYSPFGPGYNPQGSHSSCGNNLLFSCQPQVKAVPCSQYPDHPGPGYPQYPAYPGYPSYSSYPGPSAYPSSDHGGSYRAAEPTTPTLHSTPIPHPQPGQNVGSPSPLLNQNIMQQNHQQMQQIQKSMQQHLHTVASPSTPLSHHQGRGASMDGTIPASVASGAISSKAKEDNMKKDTMARMAEIAQKMRSEKDEDNKVEPAASNTASQGKLPQLPNGRSAYYQPHIQQQY